MFFFFRFFCDTTEEEEFITHMADQQGTIQYSSSMASTRNRLRALGKNKSEHQDVITDMKAIEFPQNMLLTSGRNGVVKVWI